VSYSKLSIFGMAEKEMEYRVELFNKMTQSCFNKCVENKYKESELHMGENSCIDRCVSKYWHVTNLVGQLLGNGRPPMKGIIFVVNLRLPMVPCRGGKAPALDADMEDILSK
ncbi:hypothetical protein Lal_00009899, partial [Lupinus albus]